MSALSFSLQPQSLEDPDSTNTLVLTGLTQEFFDLEVLNELRNLFASYGEINQWVKLSTLGRIIIVYRFDEDAMRAKSGCLKLIQGVLNDVQKIGLYSGEPSPLRFDSSFSDINYLKVPDLEKNFLISPPGSPPIGWEPVKEGPPNLTPLADDIIAALRKLQLRRNYPGIEMLLDPDEGSGIGISVEDCGRDEAESQWNYGERSQASRDNWRPTILPPLRASIPS